MRSGSLLTAAACLTLAAGCASSPSVAVDYDPTVAFASWATYDWQQGDAVSGNPLWDARVRRVLDTELEARGFSRDSASPDFRAAYHLSFDDRTEYASHTTYFPYAFHRRSRFWYPADGWTRTYAIPYRVGTLVLSFSDTAQERLAFEARSTERLDPDATPEEREELLRQIVRKMLDQLPAQSR